jgi:hypothetical protein
VGERCNDAFESAFYIATGRSKLHATPVTRSDFGPGKLLCFPKVLIRANESFLSSQFIRVEKGCPAFGICARVLGNSGSSRKDQVVGA